MHRKIEEPWYYRRNQSANISTVVWYTIHSASDVDTNSNGIMTIYADDVTLAKHIVDLHNASLSTDVSGKVEVHYAYCCPGSTKYCDCVNKNHGTVWIGANEVGDDYIPVTPSSSAVAVKALQDAAKLTVQDAAFHLKKYRPHCLEALQAALSAQVQDEKS